MTRCKRTIAKVNRCRREIEAFEAEDRPAYEAWTAREFGPLLTKLRETGQALGEKASLADHLQWALHAKGVPVEEVYEYVMRHRADPEYRHPVYDAEDDTVDTEGEPDGFADDTEESDEEAFFRRLFEDFFDERFGGEDDDEDEDEDEWERIAHRRKTPSAPPPEKASELKKLFRRLARRLHPDGEGATALAREQWEEAHAAYRRGDVEALRTLDTVSEVEGVPVSAKLGLARLEAIRLHNERRFRGLSAERRDLKEEPAWGFSRKKPTQIKALHSDTKGELFVNLDRMEDQLEAAEAFIYDLKRCGIEEDEALRREREEDLARRTAYEAERARRATARKANGRTRKAAEAAAPGQREFVFS
ncbi:MAG: J domain-containing protein [Opitutales bacterium]|nr:J domain-containing protein [Opitutales bacterium]